jgi:transcription antitermination factor NusG
MIESASSLNRWYAVYTIVRHEKAVSKALTEKGMEVFLPLRNFLSRWKDRIKKVNLPLFPGYLFVHTNVSSQKRLAILNTRGVVRIVGDNHTAISIPEDQILAVRSLLESRLDFETEGFDQEGKKVLITRGPLRGITGNIVERRGICRLILSVELIQRSVAVEIDIRDAEIL